MRDSDRTVALLALLLAGCTVAPTGGLPVPEQPVRVTRNPDAVWPAPSGETSLVVRTVVAGADGATEEVPGAACRAESSLYAQEFTSPARLLLPEFGTASPSLVVRCRADGRSGAVEAVPRLGSNAPYGGWPAIGVAVGTGGGTAAADLGVGFSWWGGGGSLGAEPVTLYPDLSIELR